MASVEAAASLFGAEDPASDPFAALGNEDAVPVQSTDALFIGGNATQDPGYAHSTSEDFFGAPSNTFESAVSADALPINTWPEPASNQQSYANSTNLGAAISEQPSQGYQDTQGHWKTYEAQSWDSNVAAQPAQPTSAYGSYSYSPASAPSYQEPAAAVSYDPYTPHAQATQSPPATSTGATNAGQSAYTAYTPSSIYSAPASQYGSVYSQPAQASYPPPSANASAAIPQPIAPAVAPLNRPKVSNAYDPPFPTTSRAAKRGSSRAGYAQHPGAAYQQSVPTQPPPLASPYNPSTPAAAPHVPGSSHAAESPGMPYSLPSRAPSWSHPHTAAPGNEQPAASIYGVSGSTPAQAPVDGLPAANAYAPSNYTSHSQGAPPPPARTRTSTYDPYAAPHKETSPVYAPGNKNTVVTNSFASSSAYAVAPSVPDQLPPPAGETHTRAESPLPDGSSSGPPSNVSPSLLPLPESPPVSEFQHESLAPQTSSPHSFTGHARARTHDSGAAEAPAPPTAANIRRRSSSSLVESGQAASSPYEPNTNANALRRSSSPSSSYQASARVSAYPEVAADPYAPPRPTKSHLNGIVRTSSPLSAPPLVSDFDPSAAYAPPPAKYGVPLSNDSRARSMSNGSAYSTTSNAADPYAPHSYTDRPAAGEVKARANYPHANDAYGYVPAQVPQPAVDGAQDVTVKPTMGAYAPSPSLMGSNDPLGRTSARAPVISFGFGGKLVTCFHGAASMTAGFDVALSSRNSTGVDIQVLDKIVPKSALDISSATFPGPLFSDPGSPTASLVRMSATQTKNKKARIIKYLDERGEEISRSLGYMHQGSVDGRREEGRLIFVKLLKIMIENDGRILGTPEIDDAVRKVLVPRLETLPEESSSVTMGLGFSALPDLHSSTDQETPIASSVLRPSALEKIQDFLMRGQRKEAYHYALDERLWAHAMVIASGIDKDAWQEAVNEFLKAELGAPCATSPVGPHAGTPAINGREGLRMVYSLLSGQGVTAVQELMPPSSLSKPANRLMLASPHPTPITPNFVTSTASRLPEQTCAQWTETLAMLVTSPLNKEASAAITALGDNLAASQWTEAAHVCYLLSAQTSPLGGIGNPNARIVLLGSRKPQALQHNDTDPVIFTEILEFALSLVAPVKGQEAFAGLPHLQAFRLLRAFSLAEMGEIQLASRYCEAISATLGRPSPHYTPVFMEQLKGLMDRIMATPSIDKSGSWIGSKLSKPSLDSIGGWLEGRFTKLVTGDPDSATPPEFENRNDSLGMGPFSQYNSISSAIQSARSSPQPPMVPPPRTGSAMAYYGGVNEYAPIERASSAMDSLRRKPSPVPRIASASVATSTFAQPSFYNAGYSGVTDEPDTPRPSLSTSDESSAQEVSWWGSSNASSSSTPSAAQFMKVETPLSEAGGFVSLMDSSHYSATFQNGPMRAQATASHVEEHEDDDLGFGNNSSKKKRLETAGTNGDSVKPPQKQPEPAEAQRPDVKPAPAASSSSWLSRFWKKSDTPGPVKASLGDETSFYYDKDLKRWVNKKSGSAEASQPATPPPPPSRAQTTSPGKSGPPFSAGINAGPPPPARAASAIDLSSSPPDNRPPMRVRSNLIPSSGTESAPSTPTGSRLSPSGASSPGRPKSQASKRNIRSRYVDVFQGEGGPA